MCGGQEMMAWKYCAKIIKSEFSIYKIDLYFMYFLHLPMLMFSLWRRCDVFGLLFPDVLWYLRCFWVSPGVHFIAPKARSLFDIFVIFVVFNLKCWVPFKSIYFLIPFCAFMTKKGSVIPFTVFTLCSCNHLKDAICG